MSQTIITTAFEQWKAQEAAEGKSVVLDEFVFAQVPGLDPAAPIDRNETLPAAEHIVHRQAVNKTGVVNQHAVVYAVTLGTEVGDFDFNWIGLANRASGTLAMIVHAPVQRKRATANGQQGNAITRSFLMAYTGAAVETGITTPAESWQIDFTARLSGLDEHQRLINLDHYGAAAFFGDGFRVTRSGQRYTVTAGIGYIGGLRAELTKNQPLTMRATPSRVWVDASLQGNVVSRWETVITFSLGEAKTDYVDESGFAHYVFALARIDEDGTVTDLRPAGSLSEQAANNAYLRMDDNLSALTDKAKSRKHLGLGKLSTQDSEQAATLTRAGISALSNATDSEEDTKAATPKAVKTVQDNANRRLEKTQNLADLPDKGIARHHLNVHSKNDADGRYYQKTGGTVTGSMILLGRHIILQGDDRKHLGFHNQNGSVRMWLYKDKGGDGVRLNNGNDGGGNGVFNKNGHFYSPQALHAAGATYQEDGNIHGPVWGGHLSGWIEKRIHESSAFWVVDGNNWWRKDFRAGIEFITQGGFVEGDRNTHRRVNRACLEICVFA
ncbi:phage tail protein [Candidatus Sodalis pierantonius]|uniref:phage tail-collar fiber domain-containing protein n=1 Tax=Candidatus Sodalis pierantonii TaxID=1486991 RepID=UPI00046C8EEB|nr:phage tail protein [Candidatus Sodalis pierantonius]